MKALIWIIILALIGLGIWWFTRGPADVTSQNSPVETVQAEEDQNIDLGEFEDKG